MPLVAEPFADTYARLWQELRRREWAAYAEDQLLDRTAIEQAIFEAAARSEPVATAGRSADADPDATLVEHVRRRALVDYDPEVARLRDRLDDWGTYGPLPVDPTTAWRRSLAAAMEPDLVALLRLRNALAREQGAASYGHLAMTAEGLDLDEVAAAMRSLRATGLGDAHALAADAGLTIEMWFDGLDRIAEPTNLDAVAVAADLATRLGCDDLFGRIRWTVRDGPLAGWAAAVAIPDDIRVLVRPARSLRDVATVYHELGHALAYAGTRALGIRAIPSDTQDELMGVVLELVGVQLMLPADAQERLRRIQAAESVRVATSALFEIAIQDEPERARELFEAWYRPLVAVPDPAVWALDSFRWADPFRIHAYGLGARLGATLVARLDEGFGEDPAAWGGWLPDELWVPGRRAAFAELATLLS